MAFAWMLFMFIVLGIWAAWLNQKEELLHPQSDRRAKTSALIVASIGLGSLVGFLSVQAAM